MIRCCKSLDISTQVLNTILNDSRNIYDGVVQMYNVDKNQGYMISMLSKNLAKVLNVSFAKSTMSNKIVMYTRNNCGEKLTQMYFDSVKESVDYFFWLANKLNKSQNKVDFEERDLKITS